MPVTAVSATSWDNSSEAAFKQKVSDATGVAPAQVHVLSVQDVVLRRARVLLSSDSSLGVIVTFTVTTTDPAAAEVVGAWVDAIAELPEPPRRFSPLNANDATKITVPRSTSDYHFEAVLATKAASGATVLADNGKDAGEAMNISMSGAATINNFAFSLEGSPSVNESAINGLVLSNLKTPMSGGMTIKMRGVKYVIHASSEPLAPGFSDNHYRCVSCCARAVAC
jgi:hypothetical protein